MTRVVLTFTGDRAPTVNAVYGRLDKWERARVVKVWRQRGWAEAVNSRQHTTFPGPVVITSTPLARNGASPTDVGAIFPATKAVIDGCVDAGLLPGDGPTVVIRQIFEAPRVCGHDGLEVVIEGVG